MTASALAAKLNLKPGMKVRLVGKPVDVALPGVAGAASAIAWLAYPKAGKLDTDLNRDILWRHMLGKGIQGVRQIALDEVWSAMRFRPKK
jgi:hypothetical protein